MLQRPHLHYALFVFLLFSSCHSEKFLYNVSPDTGQVQLKHNLSYLGKGQRDLYYFLQEDLAFLARKQPSKVALGSLNYKRFAPNYTGFVTVVLEESNLIINLHVNSDEVVGENLLLRGSYSTLNKRELYPIEIEIPFPAISEFNYSISNDTVSLLSPFSTRPGIVQDSITDDFVPDNLGDSTLFKVYNGPIKVHDIQVYENSNLVSMLRGNITTEFQEKITFYTLNDPLPLIPIILAGVASGGAWLAKKWFDGKDRDKAKIAVKAEDKKEEKD